MSDPGVDYRFRDRAAHLITEIGAALDRGEIDEAGWHARVADILRPAYLAAPTPQRSRDSPGVRWHGSKLAGSSPMPSIEVERSSMLGARMAC